MHKKVLVISNNCFSGSDSNGRSLGNLFAGWPKEKLAQMCVNVKDPNWQLCSNYYCINDKSMLRAFTHFKKADGYRLEKQPQDMPTAAPGRPKIGKKTISKVILREIVWAYKRWNSKALQKWVDEFDPQVIVLQFGDCIFMLNIAYHLATTRNIPLVIYNTEGYYFFPRNWFHISKFDNLLFPLYKRIYRTTVEKVMKVAKFCVYLNNKLKNDYDSVFSVPSTTIYTSSGVAGSFIPFTSNNEPQFSYLGNLGLDRDTALIEVGEVLHTINPNYAINIYGKADEAMQARFKAAAGVNYCGLVSYEEVKRIIEQTDALFHAESEQGYKQRQLQYAFSTKIADSLSSGKCFVLYAPAELACSQYIVETQSGWYAQNKEQLKAAILQIINEPHQRSQVLARAKTAAKQYHDFAQNAAKFQTILNTIE